jgi:3-methyladenine DNA glycosylase AlkD
MTCEEVLEKLRACANPKNVEGMARFGITPRNTLGVPVVELRKLAREIRRDHRLALELWESDVHEARILAGLVADPVQVTERLMERWARGFDSWDIVDSTCNNLFRKTAVAHKKAIEWAKRREEFVKRAGFVLMACLAVHDKAATDAVFARYLPLIEREASDERNFVKKAVNWALRQIGKRNLGLNRRAVAAAKRMRASDSRAARWIAADALRELTNPKTLALIRRKEKTLLPPRHKDTEGR